MGQGKSEQSMRQPDSALGPGIPAPDFMLRTTPDQFVSLSEFRGRPVVLYNEDLTELQRHHAAILGISVDGVWCHLAFARDRKLRFPLLSDFEPKGAVARSYGVYRFQEGVSERALFVIDAEGIIRWSYVSPIGVNPGADGILTALEALFSKEKEEVKV